MCIVYQIRPEREIAKEYIAWYFWGTYFDNDLFENLMLCVMWDNRWIFLMHKNWLN